IGENRLELLTLELQEQRERVLQAFLLGLGAATFGLLAGMTLTATLVVCLWPYSHVATLVSLTALYSAVALWLYPRLGPQHRAWETLRATLDQLKKDRACLERILT